MSQKWHISKIFTLFFNIIALNSNTFVTSVKKLFDASQIELWWDAVQIRLSTQWSVWSRHCATTSSDDEIGRSHWVPDLLSRVGVSAVPIQCLYHSLRNKNKVQRWWRDQAGLWVIPGEHATRILFDWHQRELFDKCNTCIAVKDDMLNNNIKFFLCHLCIILNCKTFWMSFVWTV